MRNPLFVRTILLSFVAGLLSLGIQSSVYAGMIGTDEMIVAQERDGQIARINAVLAQDQVRELLVAHGVDPEAAMGRVASLSTAELQRLDNQIESMPAGGTGVLEVLGIAFLVILILELLGVIDLFDKI